MRIYFHCQSCRRALSDLATRAGKSAICPNCQTGLLVPLCSDKDESGVEAPGHAPPNSVERPSETFATSPALISEPAAKPNSERKPHKTKPVGPSSSLRNAAGRRRNKRWAYGFSALYLALVSLAVAWAALSQTRSRPENNMASNANAEEEKEPAADWQPSPTALAQNAEAAKADDDSEETEDEPVIAKPDLERKAQLVNNVPADPPKPAAKPEESDSSNRYVGLVKKRRQTKSEEELRKDLAWVKQIGLGDTASRVLANWGKWIRGSLAGDTLQEARLINLKHASPIINTRPDLGGLPFRQGSSCQISPKEARTLAQLGPKLKLYLNAAAPVDVEGCRPGDLTLLRETLRMEMRGKRPEWLRYEAIPAMMQILMHEDKPLRALLVDMLAEIPEKQATVALAQRAVFDLAPDVREAALAALKKRSPDHYLPIFLKALRYPMPAFSDHAAEALVALDGRQDKTISQLVVMLSEPDPLIPVSAGSSGGFQRELVRANHIGNCLLCHAPAVTASDDGVIGVDPLQTVRGQGSKGPSLWGGGGVTTGPSQSLLVRADIAFIRQDFSVGQPEARTGTTLTAPVRYDYLVRLRYMPEKKARDLRKKLENEETYPQREAVLFALRELTGQDAGPAPGAWQELFPHAGLEVVAAKLRDRLTSAPAKHRDAVLNTLKEGEGPEYSVALADAIRKLPKDFQDKARQALAQRLSMMTAETLRDKLADDDEEMRKAAIEACVMKGDAALASDLSELLEDPSPIIAGLASDAIKALDKSKQKKKSSQTTEVSASNNHSQGGTTD
ncbi:MAG: HEAT repeat domain-containing protein [Gemmataceae bacterium]